MARDVNDIVVLGFGAWSDVNALPTLGYKQSDIVAAVAKRRHAVDGASKEIMRLDGDSKEIYRVDGQ